MDDTTQILDFIETRLANIVDSKEESIRKMEEMDKALINMCANASSDAKKKIEKLLIPVPQTLRGGFGIQFDSKQESTVRRLIRDIEKQYRIEKISFYKIECIDDCWYFGFDY